MYLALLDVLSQVLFAKASHDLLDLYRKHSFTLLCFLVICVLFATIGGMGGLDDEDGDDDEVSGALLIVSAVLPCVPRLQYGTVFDGAILVATAFDPRRRVLVTRGTTLALMTMCCPTMYTATCGVGLTNRRHSLAVSTCCTWFMTEIHIK